MGKRCVTTQLPTMISTRWGLALRHLAIGDVFAGRYAVVDVLGSGGMGSVYRVVDTLLDETVALKLSRPHSTTGTATTLARAAQRGALGFRCAHRCVGRFLTS